MCICCLLKLYKLKIKINYVLKKDITKINCMLNLSFIFLSFKKKKNLFLMSHSLGIKDKIIIKR